MATEIEYIRQLSKTDPEAAAQRARGAEAAIGAIQAQTGLSRVEAAKLVLYAEAKPAAGETDKTGRADAPQSSSQQGPVRNSGSFDISNFRTELNNFGVLPTHSYLVRFAPFKSSGLTKALNNYTTINKDKLIMRCDNAILPTISLLKEEAVRRYGYGPTETVPYNVNFGDFTLQWIVDNNSEVVDFFNKWINLIVNHDSKGGANMRSTGQFNNYQPYEVGFKDDYSNSNISVFVYDRQLNKTIEYNIFDAFPISIQSVNLAWGDENQLMKYNVTFAFTDMIMKTPKVGDNALYLAAQQEAADAAATRSPNEEKRSPGDTVVTGIQGNRQSASGPALGSPSAIGQYTASTPPVVQQQTSTAGVQQPESIVTKTIPLI